MCLHLFKVFQSGGIKKFPCNPIEHSVSLPHVRRNWRASVLAADQEIKARQLVRNEISSSELMIIDNCASTKQLPTNKVHEKDLNHNFKGNCVTLADYLPKCTAGRSTSRTKIQKRSVKPEPTDKSRTQISWKIPEAPIPESMKRLGLSTLPELGHDITSFTSLNPSKSSAKLTLSERSLFKASSINDAISQYIYETILIRRVKAFQAVKNSRTAIKKNQLHNHKVPKVVGKTIHLPFPMHETKKNCPPTHPIHAEHELYILVRGVPTKAKVCNRILLLPENWACVGYKARLTR